MYSHCLDCAVGQRATSSSLLLPVDAPPAPAAATPRLKSAASGPATPPSSPSASTAAEAKAFHGDGAPHNTANAVRSFLAGGVAGATAKTIIAPLDRVKIIFQISHLPFSVKAVVQELRRTIVEEGVAALFRGNMAQVIRVYPYSGIQLMSYDRFSGLILRERGAPPPSAGGRLTPGEKLAAGAAAGSLSVAATYPLDLLRARLAVQREAGGTDIRFRGLWSGARAMYADGGARSFYRGMMPTLLGITPYAAISFATFGTLKQMLADERGGAEPAAWEKLICGGIAGLAGQASTYPLDIVRRRMQTEGFTPIHAHSTLHPRQLAAAKVPSTTTAGTSVGAGIPHGTLHNAGMLDTLRRIVHLEGSRGLFKGLSLNFVKGPVSVGVSFTTFDLLKRAFNIE